MSPIKVSPAFFLSGRILAEPSLPLCRSAFTP